MKEVTASAKDGPKFKRWFPSVCPYCGVGCGVEVGVAHNKVVSVKGMRRHPVNRGRLCILGKNLVEMLYTPDRLLHPMKKTGSGFQRISWQEAAESVARRIKETIKKSGPDSFALYVSASEYLEEYYVYNKFVKGCLGTNNLESSARLCWASGVVGLVKAFGADAPPCAYDDLDRAELFFITGYNPSSSKPVFFRRMMQARKKNGTKLIVVDPRKTATADTADLYLQIKPGTDVVLHNALAHVLIKEKLIDEDQAREFTKNYDQLQSHVQRFNPAYASKVCGLSQEAIVKTAGEIGSAKAALFMWGQGLNQSSIGTRKVTTLLNLVFITGNIGKPGAGPLAITGQSSAMGLREVGALPHLLPGFRKVTDDKARKDIAEIWNVDYRKMSGNEGKPIHQIFKGIEENKIKVLWVIHANPAATFPDSNWIRKILAKVDFLIVQDSYHPTETSHYAHILLPGAQWSEKGGTLTNSERGLNLIEQAVTPPGEARPDLEIVMDIARKMRYQHQFPYKNSEEIFEEYKRCTKGRPNDISGITYGRLKSEQGIQWPVPSASHKGTKRRFMDKNFPQGKLTLNLYDHQDPEEMPDNQFPLLLITGMILWQFHSRTRTAKVEKLSRNASEPFVEIHPRDAKRYKIKKGEVIKVSSRRGAVKARAIVTANITEGAIFIPYHFGYLAGEEESVNSLTNRSFDEWAQQPEYKACAVRIQKT